MRRLHRIRTVFSVMVQSLAVLAPMLGPVWTEPASAADAVRLVATELAPYSTLCDGKLCGVMVEVVAEMAQRVGHSGVMDYVPWARAQAMGRDEADVAMVILVRSPEREAHYRWIAHVFDDESVFVTRAGGPLRIETVDEAAEHRIAVIRTSASEAFLREKGLKNLDVSETAEINARKLLSHRVDAWFGNRMMVIQALKNIGASVDQVTLGPPMRPVSVYFGGNRAIPDAEAARWADALTTMRRDGTLDRILAPYTMK